MAASWWRGRTTLSRSDGRRDASGRVIPHEFVVEDLAGEIDSVEDGRKVWPLVDGIYARIWMSEEPPSDADVQTPPTAQIAPMPRSDRPTVSGNDARND